MESNIEKQAEVVNESGFVPTSEIKIEQLPSKGKNYPEDANISIRPYSFGEVKRISDSNLSMNDKISTIISGVNTSFSKEKLTFSDITYLGMMRKLNTIGTFQASYPYTCPYCKTENEKIFSAGDLEIIDLDVEALPLSVTMSNGETYEFEPLDVKDIRIIESGKYNRIIAGKSVATDQVAVYSMLCSNKPFEEVYKFFSTTTSQDDHDILAEIDGMLNHDVKALKDNCSECKKEVHLSIENGIDLVLPFRKQEESVRSRISFGKGTVISRS